MSKFKPVEVLASTTIHNRRGGQTKMFVLLSALKSYVRIVSSKATTSSPLKTLLPVVVAATWAEKPLFLPRFPVHASAVSEGDKCPQEHILSPI